MERENGCGNGEPVQGARGFGKEFVHSRKLEAAVTGSKTVTDQAVIPQVQRLEVVATLNWDFCDTGDSLY